MENTVSLCTSKYCTTWMSSVTELIFNDLILFQLHRSKQGSPGIIEQRPTAVLIWPSYFIYQRKYQQTYKIMRCFDTGQLSESGIRNGSVTPVCEERLVVYIRFCRANMMTITDAGRFVASRGARRSGIAAPLWHIWLPSAPLRQLASSYEHACKSSPAMHLMHAWWIPNRVLGGSVLFMIFHLEAVPEQGVRRYFLQVEKLTFKCTPGSHDAFPTDKDPHTAVMYVCVGMAKRDTSPLIYRGFPTGVFT
jgi:hypothetical protein